MELLPQLLAGDMRALSRAISQVEDGCDGYRELLAALYPRSGRSLRIGITGPPGAGKSTLVNCLTRQYLERSQSVGIIAVDPSSPFTGGALLGDRVRMNEFPPGSQVFFRSMASRGASGGLAATTNNVAMVLDAFGFDITLIETVGVGQIEIDVVDACDVVVVAVVPESGDGVQTMKAGLLEIAAIMVVNKSDRPGAESLAAELRHAIRLKKTPDGDWKVPVIATQATGNVGIDELVKAIDAFVATQKQTGNFDLQRRRRVRKMILGILTNRFRQEFLDRICREIDFDQVIEKIHQGHDSPYQVADQLYSQFAGR